MSGDEPERLLTAEELAAYLAVSPQTVYRGVRSGRIPGYRVGDAWRFDRREVLAALRPSPGDAEEDDG